MKPEPHRLHSHMRAGFSRSAGRGRAPALAGLSGDVPSSGGGAPHHLLIYAALLAAAGAALAFQAPWALALAGGGFGLAALAGIFRGEEPRARTTAAALRDVNDEQALDSYWQAGERPGQMPALFDALGDIFVTLSAEGRILSANMVFRHACGKLDPIGLTLEEAGVCPVETGAGYGVELGEGDMARSWTWHRAASRDPASGELVVHAIGRDVTADRDAGELLREAKARAEAANTAKTRFLATVSHEIRTPLNGILGMTHLLSQTEVTAEQAGYLKAVRESGQSLLGLIEDLLDVTSIEAGRFHLREVECNPRDLVQTACELMATPAHEKGIEIAAHVGFDVPATILADPGRIKQVLFNLIGNAIKFTREGGVLVELERREGEIAVHVTDTGPGLKPEDQVRVFKEFERADSSSTRRHGGAGLGLSISARIVAAMGGAISVDSAPGRGSRFTFTLPLAAAPNAAAAEAFAGHPLFGKAALVLAPQGPVADALQRAITELGGTAARLADEEGLAAALGALGGAALTDLLIDRRLAVTDAAFVDAMVRRLGDTVEKTLIIAPEDSRDLSRSPEANAGKWLVRPVRAASLINVLTRRDDRAERSRAGGVGTPTLLRPSGTPTFDLLLAEDNPVNALLVRTILARAGHRVTLVDNGVDLVEAALDRPDGTCRFDLAITDLSMPELDGREAISQIRAAETAENLPRLPIVVLSADGHDETRDGILAAGADGYAAKPVDPEWLISLVSMTAAQGRSART